MKEHKIVFTGAPGAGKTTAIGAISDTAPVVTDVHNSDTQLAKERTTVGLDYGEFNLSNGECVHLFGTPGQARFDFLWHILANNALGLIILVDNSRPDPLADLSLYLDAFANDLSRVACAIGVGRTESQAGPSLDDYCDALARRQLVLPVLPVDVRRREDVLLLLDTVLAQVEARLWAG